MRCPIWPGTTPRCTSWTCGIIRRCARLHPAAGHRPGRGGLHPEQAGHRALLRAAGLYRLMPNPAADIMEALNARRLRHALDQLPDEIVPRLCGLSLGRGEPRPLYGRNLPGDHMGESWELSAEGKGISTVANGPFAGRPFSSCGGRSPSRSPAAASPGRGGRSPC